MWSCERDKVGPGPLWVPFPQRVPRHPDHRWNDPLHLSPKDFDPFPSDAFTSDSYISAVPAIAQDGGRAAPMVTGAEGGEADGAARTCVGEETSKTGGRQMPRVRVISSEKALQISAIDPAVASPRAPDSEVAALAAAALVEAGAPAAASVAGFEMAPALGAGQPFAGSSRE
jgi:hypothetical protein